MNSVSKTELISKAFASGALKKLVLSKPTSSKAKKVVGVVRSLRGRRVLALEFSLPDNTVSQKNLTEDSFEDSLYPLLEEFGQINVLTDAGDAEYKTSKSGKSVFLGADKLYSKLSNANVSFEPKLDDLERKKNHILTGDEEFLRVLEISDKNGRVHDKKQGKFRQINRFLEYVSDVYSLFPEKGTIIVYDLCSGKSYLSFAVYHYLTKIKGRAVDMLCVDLKGSVMDYCRSLAKSLSFDGMKFLSDDIENTPRGVTPHMVISLHACDVATDIVLDKAVRLGAKVILSTPCCHKNLSDKINSPSLSFVTKYPKLRGKLCEAITDALRLERLKAFGYEASATELVDPEDTPKNVMLKAVLKGHYSEKLYENYKELLKSLLGDGYSSYLKNI